LVPPGPATAAVTTSPSASRRSSRPRSADSSHRRRRAPLRLRRRRRSPSRCIACPAGITPWAARHSHARHHRGRLPDPHPPGHRPRGAIPRGPRFGRLHHRGRRRQRLAAHRPTRRRLPQPPPGIGRRIGGSGSRAAWHHSGCHRRSSRLLRGPPTPHQHVRDPCRLGGARIGRLPHHVSACLRADT